MKRRLLFPNIFLSITMSALGISDVMALSSHTFPLLWRS
ncbi:hypothetical protein Chls_679 [Chlamydia suis]|uniref:Uncharacterized protein n=1 Tax=Chlamydia suis TaxID=83559 RepID=A0ABX6IUE3_9CHLA|nr:hypothetical protein Chls_679 [Chlamydia suis]